MSNATYHHGHLLGCTLQDLHATTPTPHATTGIFRGAPCTKGTQDRRQLAPSAPYNVHPTLAAPCMCGNLQDAHCSLQQQHSGQSKPCTTGTLIVHNLAGCALQQRHLHQRHLATCTQDQQHSGPATPCTSGTLQRATYTSGTVHVHLQAAHYTNAP